MQLGGVITARAVQLAHKEVCAATASLLLVPELDKLKLARVCLHVLQSHLRLQRRQPESEEHAGRYYLSHRLSQICQYPLLRPAPKILP